MSTETLRTDNPHGGLHSEAIGSCVAGQLEVPLVVVDRRLVPAWANGAAYADAIEGTLCRCTG